MRRLGSRSAQRTREPFYQNIKTAFTKNGTGIFTKQPYSDGSEISSRCRSLILQPIEQFKARLRLPYSMRHVPIDQFNHLIDIREFPISGDIVLASVEKIAKNSAIELDNGRRSSLHEGDIIAAVFGNRYATLQFEGLAQRNGDFCDLLSMGGLCGIVQSKHAKVAEPTKLRLLGAVSDSNNHPLSLRNCRVQHTEATSRPHIIVVCGSSMDAGKTYTAMSIIKGLEQSGKTVAGIKLTGTATGKDTWNMLDGGACVALDFVDGGFPSTYLCDHDELLQLFRLLVGYAAANSAEYVVIEIADGLLQRETAMLLQSSIFTREVDTWVFAGGDPMSAESGVRMMRNWRIQPTVISGVLTMSPLNIGETELATGLTCMTARELQDGALNGLLNERVLQARTAPVRKSA